MKTKIKSSEKIFFGFAVVLFFFLVADGFAQNKMVSDLAKQKNAVANLINAIHSENDGVRESAIYLVGEYRFIDMEDALIKQLRVEKNSDIKILIGLALFRMNSEKGMNELQNLTIKDPDQKVRRMSQAIYNEFLVTNSNLTATAKQ